MIDESTLFVARPSHLFVRGILYYLQTGRAPSAIELPECSDGHVISVMESVYCIYAWMREVVIESEFFGTVLLTEKYKTILYSLNSQYGSYITQPCRAHVLLLTFLSLSLSVCLILSISLSLSLSLSSPQNPRTSTTTSCGSME